MTLDEYYHYLVSENVLEKAKEKLFEDVCSNVREEIENSIWEELFLPEIQDN